MSNVDAVESDNENARSAPRSKRKSVTISPSKDRNASMEVDEIQEIETVEVPDDSEAASGPGSEEEEYEIEAILDAKKGAFPQGRTGYFVKWKGYGEDENSWVDEKDAGNAGDLIEEYWRKVKKEKQSARQSLDQKSKSRRKSATTTRPVEPGQTKKRGRLSRAEKELRDRDDAASDEGEAPANKKPRKSNGARTASRDDQDEEASPPVGDMSKYMQVPTWENMIQTIDTVERAGNELLVFFTLKMNGERVQVNSKLCAEKFPKKMLEFYESNLRWKIDDENSET